ncbi:uncharacterized protein C3orf14 homolog [Electrophorus electricus]|uniref:uncharacterized protein C3orf14 homolog n=1 Tax=Electrophorus electricus TaxID=8005 RepID=UPI000F0A0F01|nr:uncharacterized protein C3orf14 homolog [Electrophorus electricus]XP_035376376.1 uncharacterized protein C3orf14 homolog [Electrophorus electricus]XP_035376377.1 uncharacterized protein C3orf14 homolog [Electrophorus electricus]XP_035376378.1 uncharacterized protein C3orf14 homolog [Electrophorus electricus]
MAANVNDEDQLSRKHEEILGMREALLQQMEVCYQQHKAKKRQQAVKSEAAHERNAKILEDFQKVETRLQTRPVLHPDILTLQTCYWGSVEQKLPEWERHLLGKGKASVRDTAASQGLHSQKATWLGSSSAQNRRKPPRPKP